MEDYRSAFETFANQVKKGVVLFGDDEEVLKLHITTEHLYYGLHDNNDVQAVNVIQNENGMQFDVLYKKKNLERLNFHLLGNLYCGTV